MHGRSIRCPRYAPVVLSAIILLLSANAERRDSAPRPPTPFCAVLASEETVRAARTNVERLQVPFNVPAYPGEIFYGTLNLLAHDLDEKTRSMAVELDVKNPISVSVSEVCRCASEGRRFL
jgi:hypothetical protein